MESARPSSAVSCLILREDGHVLVVRRTRAPYAGAYSLPGGRLADGEAPEVGAARELREETGILAPPLEPLATTLAGEYRVLVLFGHVGRAEPRAGSDADVARFVPIEALAELPTTPGLTELVASVWRRRR
ncbi:MAG: NUDIX domain-containing protein [Myxococcales bacterium]|nr:NUDIX domain-containing protein [Myxococcales bacterium]